MEKLGLDKIEQKFQTPEEEIQYLRNQIKQKEKNIENVGQQPDREKIIEHTISDYKQNSPCVINPSFIEF